MYITRTQCIFCKTKLSTPYFENDYENCVAHYCVDVSSSDTPHTIPFNILVCPQCKTAQTKYLGDINEIYKVNHADSTGSTMMNLHKLTRVTLLKYKNKINNILEIGSSVGVLADLILDEYSTEYTIIEPTFYGNRTNKRIIDSYYENVEDNEISANTLIISHVFEHFYNPLDILEKISKNKNITLFCLVFPDLEYYINNNILHVLNTEHTYYIDNDFLVSMLKVYGFTLLEKINYVNHSVIFVVERSSLFMENNCISDIHEINFINENYSLDKYFSYIFNTVSLFNTTIVENCDKQIYAWPSSIHILYLFIFGLKLSRVNLLDNSVNKINKKIYGYDLIVYSFSKIVSEDNPATIILINGGIFNNDIKDMINNSKNIQFVGL